MEERGKGGGAEGGDNETERIRRGSRTHRGKTRCAVSTFDPLGRRRCTRAGCFRKSATSTNLHQIDGQDKPGTPTTL
jgi:hypothetical protein